MCDTRKKEIDDLMNDFYSMEKQVEKVQVEKEPKETLEIVKSLTIIFNSMLRDIDHEYVARRKLENDHVWKDYEKCLYYDKTNENYVIPTVVLCVIALFTNPPGVGLGWIVAIIIGALLLCRSNNIKLDSNPYIRNKRMRWKNAIMKDYNK